ncbi:MAG: DNA replication/repair protein RecF [Dehalococcoidia bacterium]
MHISSISISNFRNYSQVQLQIPSGLTLIEGKNGHGKSNLLEALYMLSIAKSHRLKSESGLINKNSLTEMKNGLTHTFVGANSINDGNNTKVEIHYTFQPANTEKFTTEKFIKINDVKKKTSDLIGIINSVLFTVDDLKLIFGQPSTRRRYLDILLSQTNVEYFKFLQGYQKSTTQRNHLLKSIREGKSQISELEFWDNEIATKGSYIVKKRQSAINNLSILAQKFHKNLSNDAENLTCEYASTSNNTDNDDESIIKTSIIEKLGSFLSKDISQGSTSIGPHRDDIKIKINGIYAIEHASRGQARTAVLSLKLAEADYLKRLRKTEPILLMDDLLSELDINRKKLVMDHISSYEQCIATTAEPNIESDLYLINTNKLIIENGNILEG